jgi:hypothetical protein
MAIHREVQLALTPQSFIALWLAIHGGDPAPEPLGVLVGGVAVLEHLQAEDVKAGELRGQVVGAMEKALAASR